MHSVVHSILILAHGVIISINFISHREQAVQIMKVVNGKGMYDVCALTWSPHSFNPDSAVQPDGYCASVKSEFFLT